MIYRIEVSCRPDAVDVRGQKLSAALGAFGRREGVAVSVADVYFLDGDVGRAELTTLCEELLCDGVVEQARILEVGQEAAEGVDGEHRVEVALRPGVTDSVAESLLAAASRVGVGGIQRVACAHRYSLRGGDWTRGELERVASGLLANGVIQTWVVDGAIEPPFVHEVEGDGRVETIGVRGLSGEALEALSAERRLSLDRAEMEAIAAWYTAQERDPTDVELEMIAQTWSEHCVHKTFRARIDFEHRAADGTVLQERTIDSLLNTFIRAATDTIGKAEVRSAFVDNAGIVAFNDGWDLAFKVETHNHPSAREPFGGANTGIGGVVRDVIGVSARPIANTDVLCFGPQELALDALPSGVLHPHRVQEGVIDGIEDYGNKMGIPTVNGAILYDPGYTANPLVYCGCLGVLPRGGHPTEVRAGQLIVVVGGRTGRDGIRGATFSSMEMSHETSEVAGTAVQIGHPIHEKQALELVMLARDEGLYSAITDCGAGGLSSAVGEMGQHGGAVVELLTIPLKYRGLRPWEMWLSEAQERMVLAVEPAHWPRLAELARSLDVEAVSIGTFRGDGRLVLTHGGEVVGELEMGFLHDGIPQRHLRAVHVEPAAATDVFTPPVNLSDALLAALGLPDIASKESVVRRYDHEVQGGTVVKPFVGVRADGPSDAAVLVPLECQLPGVLDVQGVALANGINPHYGKLDPYRMAIAVVDEAMRNCVAVGADPDQVFILDNFCWGNPRLPDRLGSLVRCAEGCYDAAVAFGAPYVSGKDSLNNEYVGLDGEKHAIPGTLLISSLGIVPNVRHTTTSDLKAVGDRLYVLGTTRDELGGSALHRLAGHVGGRVPGVIDGSLELLRALHRAIASGLVRACHDLSEGGLAVAAAEMCIGGRLGAHLDVTPMPTDAPLHAARLLFSESLTRFLVEVAPADAEAFEASLSHVPLAAVGRVTPNGRLTIVEGGEIVRIDVGMEAMVTAFKG